MGFLYVCKNNLYILVFPYILTNLIRPYGSLSLDEESLNLIMLLFPIVNGSTRILWGFLCDYFGFKFVYLFLLSLGVNKI